MKNVTKEIAKFASDLIVWVLCGVLVVWIMTEISKWLKPDLTKTGDPATLLVMLIFLVFVAGTMVVVVVTGEWRYKLVGRFFR